MGCVLSNKFHPGHHEDGHMAYQKIRNAHGSVFRIADPAYTQETAEVEGFTHKVEEKDGKPVDVYFATIGGIEYKLDARTTLDGVFGRRLPLSRITPITKM